MKKFKDKKQTERKADRETEREETESGDSKKIDKIETWTNKKNIEKEEIDI